MKITIASLKHRIALCTMHDIVDKNGTMELAREDVFQAWAAIENKKGSSFSRAGYTVEEKQDVQTHEIYLRYRRDFEISNMAWVFEERAVSAPRWFKVLKIKDAGEKAQFWCLSCRLVESSDDATFPVATPAEGEEPFSIVASLPRGVNL